MKLDSLPVELLYELQLYALSHSLPYICRSIYLIFSATPSSYRAEYLLGRTTSELSGTSPQDVFTRVLRYPLCSAEVLDAFCHKLSFVSPTTKSLSCELPRRLFRALAPKPGNLTWKADDPPLPFLRYLFISPTIPTPDVNSHSGYALTKAVYAKFVPLVQFLLCHRASPRHKDCLAVMVAIRQKDLGLVKMLIERDSHADDLAGQKLSSKKTSAKRRRLEDRVEINREMVKLAVRCDAKDIVEYFTREKGCIPDIQTLHMISRWT